jgi:mono/diheme cytochrome c family protein
MYRGPEVQPMTLAPRVMPEGTLPINRGEPPMSVEQAALSLHNPLKPTPEVIGAGKALYAEQCAVCHGARGSGDGSVVSLLHQQPKDLTGAESSTWSDGFIYGVSRNGYGYMPPMGDALMPNERWAVILYVRALHLGPSVPQIGAAARAEAPSK